MANHDVAHERVIHKVLEEKANRYGNREFLNFEGRTFGYEDFDREAGRVAAGFQALGAKKGDKIAIVMKNRPEYLFLWFGLSKIGAIEVPINTAHKGAILTYMIDQADCRFIVTEEDFLDRVAPVLEDLPKVEKVLVLGGKESGMENLGAPAFDYGRVVDNDGAYKEVEVLWSDPFVIMFTSGTTGPSKGSLMPQNYALYMGEIISSAGGYTEKDHLYNALPLFHGNAQMLSTMPALMSGARMTLAERFSASRFWDEIRKHGCTEFNYIGGILPILYKADPRPDDADNPLRVMVGAGASKELFEPFEKRFGVALIEGYGMSEIGIPLMNTIDGRKPGSCGKVWPDYTVKVVDDNGLEVGPGMPGELLLRPGKQYTMLLEYYRMPEKTLEAWRDMWFHTGDYLYRDEEDYFYFVDRKKDALRRRGENISSYEVEKGINSHPAVMECAVVAVKSDMAEDEVMACVCFKPGQEVLPHELLDHCQECMAYFMVPRYVRIMERFPKTATERVQKAKLREEGVTADTWDREKENYKVKR